MREIRLHGSEGGGIETNRSFPPLFAGSPVGASRDCVVARLGPADQGLNALVLDIIFLLRMNM